MSKIVVRGREPYEIKEAQEKAKKEAAEKKKVIVPKVKTYYDVKVECMLPATLTYKVLADDEQQALELIKNKAPNNVKPNLLMKNIIKATVYLSGSSVVKFVKNYSHRTI